jgi:hypothetical protein
VKQVTERGIRIKQKLIELGKKQTDLVVELKARGIRACKSSVSESLNCPRCASEHRIAEVASEIVIDWEREAKEAKRRKKKEA